MTSPGKTARRGAGPSIAALILFLAWVLPASAAALASRPGEGDLSPRLAELAKPSVRSAPQAAQARALSVAVAGPGSLLREGDRVLVEVRFDRGAVAGVDDLRTVGAKVISVSPRYQTVTVAAKPSELTGLSAVPHVTTASEVLAPIASASTCPAGVAVSEGLGQLRADEAQAPPFALDGSGVTVGILSDTFDRATEAADESGPIASKESNDVASGDLPGAGNTCTGQETPVDVLDDTASKGEDEGRAMAQIVHDLAPAAKLAFATAFTSETDFAENIEKLAKPVGEGGAEADVIADDVTYFKEPFFQEGRVGAAVSKVTGEGVSYFSSAANNNLVNTGHDIASWETPQFRDSSPSGCPEGLPSYAQHCMDFDPGNGVDPDFGITVAPKATLILDLQWAQPWFGVTTDLDAYLLSGTTVLAPALGTEVHNVATGEPVEVLGWKNSSSSARTIQLAIDRCDSSCDALDGGDVGKPRVKFALLENGSGVVSTEYQSSTGGDVVGPTIFGHNGGEDATSVGAIQYGATESPEPYSSRGPVTHYFGPLNGIIPAAPLPEAQVISKPDVTATDCGRTTFFASFQGVWRFCGTSAAAPHAAAVAALMLQDEPAATPQQIRLALEEGATPIGSFGACAVGAGLVDAVGALEALLAPGSFSAPVCAPPKSGPVVEGGSTEPTTQAEEQVTITNPPIEVPPPEEPPVVRRPRTLFLQHPPRVIRTPHAKAKVVFRFGPSESGVTFVCRVDGDPFHPCGSRFVRRFEVGAHVLRVVATDAAGNADRTAAIFHFRVKQAG